MALLTSNCGQGPVDPTAATYPRGVSDPTALANLALVTRLERAKRPDSVLVRIEGSTNQLTGRPGDGYFWSYVFERWPAEAVIPILNAWTAYKDGQVEFEGERVFITNRSPPLFDIAPSCTADSDYVTRIAVESDKGGQFLLKHVDVMIRYRCVLLAGRVIWGLTFIGRPAADQGYCEQDFLLDAASGEILHSEGPCV